jgi:primosomal protein N' (replication factor Y) (superfamily II helicase)
MSEPAPSPSLPVVGTHDSAMLGAAAVCRVVILPAAGETGLLDYAVPSELRPVLQPGMRVIVPLGSRRCIGLVTEIAAASSHPRLRAVASLIDRQPMLSPELLKLCAWMAEYYLCTVGEAVSAALPGTLTVRLDRVVHLADTGANESRSASQADRAVLAWLATEGPQSTRALAQRFGAAGQRVLARLRRAGVVRVEEQLRNMSDRTKRERYYRAASDPDAEVARALRAKRPAQYAIFEYLHRHPLGRARFAEVDVTFPNAGAKLRALVAAGMVETIDEQVYRAVLPHAPQDDQRVVLTGAQREAIDTVQQSVNAGFAAFLLWGVTGSGKTEVYLQCAAACLAAGRTVLVLVPEISLTHQLVDRVRARFGERVAVLHSGLSDGERWDEWHKIARGEVAIAVGARSAVFAPLPRLGLIVVDEEHDSAYKQEDGIRYNGRDVAVVRARLTGCPVLLGSATPAMETFHNGRNGRYRLLTLPERVEARPLPTVDVVDLRKGSAAGRSILISTQLVAALRANLAARGQSLIFLNRRGFANFLQCHQCGTPLACPNCSVTLTWHRRWQALRCHHCDYTIPPPATCSTCGGLALGAWGAGTEQVEATLRKLVPGARVGRMDRDTTRRKGTQREILSAWERREYDILVGTQMITKGHDIPGVTLVGVLLADMSLNFPDFRAAERTFQLLTQVAGRAGRGSQPGRVIVQTLQPTHFSLQYAAQHDFRGFADVELGHRRESGYPPFTRMVLVRCEGERADAVERIARAVATEAQAHAGGETRVLGPTPAPIERLRRRYRWQLLLRGRRSGPLRRAAARARHAIRRDAKAADVRVIVDVDPYSML